MLGMLTREGRRARDAIYALPAPPIIRSLAGLAFRVIHNFSRDDGSHMAAGVAYYAIFSIFPLMLGTIAVAGMFVSAEDVQARVLDFFETQIGVGSEEILTGNIDTLVNARGAVGLLAIVALFWTSRAVFGAVHRVLNRAWKVTDPPHFLWYQVGQVASAAGIAAAFMLSTTIGTAGRAIAGQTEELFGISFPWNALFTFTPLVVSTLIFLFVYRFVPDANVRWRDAIPAAVLASVLFEVAKTGFAFYLTNLSSLDLVYGGVTTVVVLMLFLYVVAMVLVLGGEFSSEYHRSSQSGSLTFKGHWAPVRGGLAPAAHRQLAASAGQHADGLVHPEGF
jgi:membrane protein